MQCFLFFNQENTIYDVVVPEIIRKMTFAVGKLNDNQIIDYQNLFSFFVSLLLIFEMCTCVIYVDSLLGV